MSSKSAGKMDKVVGNNIRIHRLAKKLSQTQLAESLGITFQQIQKYESGTNRVGSGRLFQISKVLGVPLMSFFEGGDAGISTKKTSPLDLLADPQSFKLVAAFAEIPSLEVRRALLALVRAVVH